MIRAGGWPRGRVLGGRPRRPLVAGTLALTSELPSPPGSRAAGPSQGPHLTLLPLKSCFYADPWCPPRLCPAHPQRPSGRCAIRGCPGGSSGLSHDAPGQGEGSSSKSPNWKLPGPGPACRWGLGEEGMWPGCLRRRLGTGRLQKPDWGAPCILGVWSRCGRCPAMFSQVSGYSLAPYIQ